jgi:hypothetical protein
MKTTGRTSHANEGACLQASQECQSHLHAASLLHSPLSVTWDEQAPRRHLVVQISGRAPKNKADAVALRSFQWLARFNGSFGQFGKYRNHTG